MERFRSFKRSQLVAVKPLNRNRAGFSEHMSQLVQNTQNRTERSHLLTSHNKSPPAYNATTTHLMPVQRRLVDLFHRAWGKMVDEAVRRGRKKTLQFTVQTPGDENRNNTYVHKMTPLFRPFWKSEPMDAPVSSSIQTLSSSSF